LGDLKIIKTFKCEFYIRFIASKSRQNLDFFGKRYYHNSEKNYYIYGSAVYRYCNYG